MTTYKFNVEQTTQELIDWVSDYFKEQGPKAKAVIGISGGKDSSVCAALAVKALGKERVLGVLMPCGEQEDIQYSYDLCKDLGIPYVVVNIKDTLAAEYAQLEQATKLLGYDQLSTVTTFNTPARIRMTTLYGISGTVGGRCMNTSNLSEDWVGYATKFGDGAGDLSPLMKLTVQEIKAIGRFLGLHEKYIEKTPIDGLCGQTDEDNLGFTYAMLDRYIREGVCEDTQIKEKIDTMHKYSRHKLLPMPHFVPNF